MNDESLFWIIGQFEITVHYEDGRFTRWSAKHRSGGDIVGHGKSAEAAVGDWIDRAADFSKLPKVNVKVADVMKKINELQQQGYDVSGDSIVTLNRKDDYYG